MQAHQKMSGSQINGACAIGGSSHRGLCSQHQTKLAMGCCIECICCLQKASDTKLDDYRAVTAFFFPGQGAQTVGMAKVGAAICAEGLHILGQSGVRHQPFPYAVLQDVAAEIPAAKQLFEHASDVLGYDLLKVCVEGGCSALLLLSP